MSQVIQGYGNDFAPDAVKNGVVISGTKSGTSISGRGGTYVGSGVDSVRMSAEGRQLASSLRDSLILPTAENVRLLSAALSDELDRFFARAGIESQPPVEMSVDWNSGNIQIGGERGDKKQIEELINGDADIAADIRNLAAISSHAAAMADSLKFQAEYRTSSNPESVAARYACLFGSGQPSHDIALVFDGDGVQVMSDGNAWISSSD
ncbi:MAG: hypothetical protein CSYNP_04397 [Syntrophus sp. SKADARSKE-3]|nr:hypothetical protein [Syntrophus sp. SKADARSKE-3]